MNKINILHKGIALSIVLGTSTILAVGATDYTTKQMGTHVFQTGDTITASGVFGWDQASIIGGSVGSVSDPAITTVSVAGGGGITVTNKSGYGGGTVLARQAGSVVNLGNGSIINSTGFSSGGYIGANGLLAKNSGQIIANNITINSTSDAPVGVYAALVSSQGDTTGGTITLTGLTTINLNLTGNGKNINLGAAVKAYGSSSVITAENVSINTIDNMGANMLGISGYYADDSSQITVSGSSKANLIGAQVMGVNAYSNSNININKLDQTVMAKTNGYGVYAGNGSKSTINVLNQTVSALNTAYGVYSSGNNSVITINEGTSDTNSVNGSMSLGLLNTSGAQTFVSNFVGSTTNEAAAGTAYSIYNMAGLVKVDTASLTSSGNTAYGIYINNSNATANVTLNNTMLTSHGNTSGAAIYNTNQATSPVASTITISDSELNSANDGIVVASGKANVNISNSNMSNASNKAFIVEGNTSNQSTLDLSAYNSKFSGVALTDSAAISNIGLNENTYWGVTGDSNLTTLNLNNSSVDMTRDGNTFSTLTMNNLTGSGGTFTLDIDGSTVNKNDRLYITDTFSGTQALALNETSGHVVGTEAVGTVLARVNANEGTFTAVDGEGTLYWNRYTLDTKAADDNAGYTTDWYLKAIENIGGETTTTNVVKSAGALNYYNWRENDKLLQRLGELRANGDKESGIWFRVKGNKIGRNGDFGFGSKSTQFELGYDTVVERNKDLTRYQGFSLSYAKGTSSYDRGTGDNKQIGASFYQTDIRDTGHYLDLIAKVSQSDNDFTVYNTRGQLITGKISSPGISISAEYGRKKELTNNWYIEPQVQMTIGYLGGDTYTINNGVHVNQDGIKSAVARIGFNIGKNIGNKGVVYLKANLLHEFWGNYGVTMTDYADSVRRSADFGDTWVEYGIGTALKINENSHIYIDAERSAGSSYKKDWQWNVGARWNF